MQSAFVPVWAPDWFFRGNAGTSFPLGSFCSAYSTHVALVYCLAVSGPVFVTV